MNIFKRISNKLKGRSSVKKIESSENTQLADNLPKSERTQPINELVQHPEMRKHIEDTIKQYGIPGTISNFIEAVIANPENYKIQAIASMYFTYIGTPAIPRLCALLAHGNFNVAKFASKTLAEIEGSLPYFIKALQLKDPNVRYHACGGLQAFGAEAAEAIPELCEIIRSEGNSELGGIAAGTLGGIGEAANPALKELLKHEDRRVRLAAVAALSKVGKTAMPLLYELRNIENDQEILNVIDLINNKKSGNDADDIVLPPGAGGSLVGLIAVLSMQPMDIELYMWDKYKTKSDVSIASICKSVEKSKNITAYNISSTIMNDMGEKAIPSLIKLLGDKDRYIGRITGDILTAIGLTSIPYLLKAVESENTDTRDDALGALLRIAPQGFGPKTEEITDALGDIIRKEELSFWDIILKAAATLALIGSEGIPMIYSLMSDKKSLVRLAAVAALFKIGGQKVIPILKEFRGKENNSTVTEGIDYALQKIKL